MSILTAHYSSLATAITDSVITTAGSPYPRARFGANQSDQWRVTSDKTACPGRNSKLVTDHSSLLYPVRSLSVRRSLPPCFLLPNFYFLLFSNASLFTTYGILEKSPP